MKKKAVLLMSGGMDSTLCTSIAFDMGYSVAGLHLNYGQLTQKREEQAFNDICNYFQIQERLIVDVQYFSQIGNSSLTDRSIPVHKANLDNTSIPNSYVPFRNGNILSIAASWAEAIGAVSIFIGAVQADSSGYPDCRMDFIEAFETAINLGTKPDTLINIIAPLVNLTKKEIVLESIKLGSPLELTWSCYQDSEEACGICDSCALRLRGFQQAEIEDKIKYKI